MAERRRRDGLEEHRRRQVRDVLRTTPAQRLAWVEEAIELARRAGALPRVAVAGEDDAEPPREPGEG